MSWWVYFVGILAVIIGAGAFFGAPYVPTRRRDLKRMFDELQPVTSRDVVLDFGSGDGLILREASRRGAKAVGFEINPVFWAISKLWSLGDKRVTAVLCNAWLTDFPAKTTIIYAFAVSRDSKRLAKKVQKEANRLKRPLFLVCYGSPFPDIKPLRNFEAYHLYQFQPLHLS